MFFLVSDKKSLMKLGHFVMQSSVMTNSKKVEIADVLSEGKNL